RRTKSAGQRRHTCQRRERWQTPANQVENDVALEEPVVGQRIEPGVARGHGRGMRYVTASFKSADSNVSSRKLSNVNSVPGNQGGGGLTRTCPITPPSADG